MDVMMGRIWEGGTVTRIHFMKKINLNDKKNAEAIAIVYYTLDKVWMRVSTDSKDEWLEYSLCSYFRTLC